MKYLIVFVIGFLSLGLYSQTPQIMHKRMGGNNANFYETLSNPNALIRKSNFGLPPTIHVKKAVIDSIIVMNDSTVIVVTSNKIIETYDHWGLYDDLDSVFVCSDSMLAKSLEYDSTGNWKPGRDTLVNHAIFSPRLSCEEILAKLAQDYLIHNVYENQIIFIGFDCSKKNVKTKRNFFILLLNYLPKNPDLLILLIGILSLLYFWQANRKPTYSLKKVAQQS